MAAAQQTTPGTTITGIDMAGYLVTDPGRAIAFYRDKLGIQPTELDPEGRGAEFTLPDGTTFGVWRDPETPSSGGFVMFTVADAKATVTELRARGVAISDPMETPVCLMAFGDDPDGNGYIIHQRKDGHA